MHFSLVAARPSEPGGDQGKCEAGREAVSLAANHCSTGVSPVVAYHGNGNFIMAAAANPWNPYLESLVQESETIWPAELNLINPADRQRIEAQLHADPAKAAQLEYVRLYTGFNRRITVTPADIARLGGMPSPAQPA